MDSILVVDDDKEVIQLVRTFLEAAGYTVFTAHDGETALHQIKREQPALVVLDLMLPERNGWDVTQIIRRNPALKRTGIIMLTARIEDIDRILGLELGADDYIVKPFNPREVVARVRTVLRRLNHEGESADQALASGPIRLNPASRMVGVGGVPVTLTPTEFKLLHLLISSPNRVFTRAELVEQVFGYDYDSADRVLDSHIRNLRKKLSIDEAAAEAIQTVYGVGYRLLDAP